MSGYIVLEARQRCGCVVAGLAVNARTNPLTLFKYLDDWHKRGLEIRNLGDRTLTVPKPCARHDQPWNLGDRTLTVPITDSLHSRSTSPIGESPNDGTDQT